MKKKYLLTMAFMAFFSILSSPQIWAQAGCGTLAITSSTPATINCGGTATLTATASGTGDNIFWYDAATAGNKVGEGTSFTTPVLGATTSYWATEVLLTGTTYTGIGMTTGSGDTDNYFDDTGLEFTAAQSFTIVSVEVYNEDSGAQTVDIQLRDASDTVLQTINASLPAGNGTSGGPSAPTTVTLNFVVPGPGTYRLVTDNNNADLLQDTSPTFPYPIGPGAIAGQITGGYGSQSTNYNFFYNWTISTETVTCESTPRTQVTATVNSGDKTVTMTGAPGTYTDTDDTANFGNSYSGAPGSNCGTTAGYLGGNEVVYYYTAGASYALNIAMSGLSAGESGVFIYESCLDIGTTCVEGMTSTSTTNYDFDIIVQSGEDYYIVVSSSAATGTVGYTLTLTETASPCLNLAITNTTDATIPCIGSGTLTATASGIGNDIYWYDAATAGNLVGIGPTYTTPQLTATTSYWATEVITTGTPSSGYGRVTGSGDFDNPHEEYGLVFDVDQQFTLVSVDIYSESPVGETATIELRDSNDAVLQTATATFPPGNGSSSGPSTPTTVQLNFLIPPADDYRLVLNNVATTGDFLANTSGNSFPYALGLTGLAGEIKSGITSSGSTPSTYYTFYNWSITTGSVVCESPRVQATATISTTGDITVAPTAANPLPYSNTNDSANYGDPYSGPPGSACGTTESYLNGNNVVYHFTPDTTEMVNILMSNLSGYYAGVFVYDSCADIGTTCLAGAVAGPSDNDFGIMDFPVTAGEDYYIVVTSWLTPTIGYTLDIVPFDCATLEDPDGVSPQDFVLGDTPSDLDVDPTRTGATLNWYSDAAGTIPIDPATEPLVDGITYYVTQTFNGCESAPPLGILVDQIDCSTLAITATTDDTVSCKGSLTLTATSSGTGDNIYWFNAATGGNIVATGPTFQTPILTSTTSYWAAEVFTSSGGGGGGPLPTYCVPTFTSTGCSGFDDDIDDFVLTNSSGSKIIEHLGTGCSPSSYGDYTTDPNLTGVLVPGNTYNFNATHNTTSGNEITIFMDLNQNGSFADAGEILFSSPTSLPGGPTIGSFTIPASVGGVTVMRVVNAYSGPATNACNTGELWGEVHDYKVIVSSLICESPRTEVVATVNQSGDVVVDHTQVAPTYTTTDNTSVYGNDFSGDPGTGCDGAGILDGDDVVYQYTADPANDDILDIELSAISNPNTGMYIYASCGDIGTACIAGGTNENGLTINIDDYYVTAGTTFFIVISSESSSTNYTLTINGIDCANVAAPTIADPTPYFIGGDFLSDLDIVANQYNTGLTWYAELSDIPGSPIADPTIETIMDGEDYYVTQTVLGCEGSPLLVTPEEFPCGNMKIASATPDFYVCAPGGNVTLTAQGSGVGEKVYWYDAPTAGNLLNVGSSYDLNVTATTSVWVSEVFLNELVTTSGYGLSTWSYGYDSSSSFSDRGIAFKANRAFKLVSVDVFSSDVGGSMEVALVDGSGTELDMKTVTLPSGSTSSPTLVTLTLNFDIPSPGNYQLLVRAGTGYPDMMYEYDYDNSDFAYPMPIGLSNAGELIGGVTGSSVYDYYYYHFYNWAIVEEGVSCESARTEITVTVNDQPTDAPTGNAAQKFCEGQTLADVAISGNNIQWYDAATGGSAVSSSTVLTDGAVYYASQTVNACESDARTEITVYVDPIAAAPAGNINQSFYDGEFVSDLDVVGDNLTWYEEDGTPIADPTTFPLENYETYCVAQTPADACESEMLCITVHELLGADDPLFEGLSYYPNPVRHKLFITNTAEIEKVELYDLMGRKVLQKEFNGTKGALDVSGLQSGTYLLWVTIDGKTGAFKLIKE